MLFLPNLVLPVCHYVFLTALAFTTETKLSTHMRNFRIFIFIKDLLLFYRIDANCRTYIMFGKFTQYDRKLGII